MPLWFILAKLILEPNASIVYHIYRQKSIVQQIPFPSILEKSQVFLSLFFLKFTLPSSTFLSAPPSLRQEKQNYDEILGFYFS